MRDFGGLWSTGDTCYVSAVLQCLFRIPGFLPALRRGRGVVARPANEAGFGSIGRSYAGAPRSPANEAGFGSIGRSYAGAPRRSAREHDF
jgi:hypothetical protein